MPHTTGWYTRQRLEKKIQPEARKYYLDKRADLLNDLYDRFLPQVPESELLYFKKRIHEWMLLWEAPARRHQREALTNLTPSGQLANLHKYEDRIRIVLEAALTAAEEAATPQNVNSVITAANSWSRIRTEMSGLITKLEVEDQWAEDRDVWLKKKKASFDRVYREYKGRGEVYKMLCDRLAAVNVGLQRLEELGRVDSAEYRDLSDRFVQTVAQIQKHTESLKTENLDVHVQEIGQRFLKIVENRLFNQPDTLRGIIADIEGELVEGQLGEPLQLIAGGKP